MSMEDQRDNLAFPHFALIYIDRDGNLRQEASQSIAHSSETILSPRVRDAFLRAVAMSNNGPSPLLQFESGPPVPRRESTTGGQVPLPLAPQTVPILPSGENQRFEGHRRIAPTPPGPPIQWPSHQEPPHWPKQSPQHAPPPNQDKPSGPDHQRAFISVKDKEMLRHYYEKVFQNLQQTNCRVLAKAYIKLVEPRKQVNYPYNGRKIVAGRTRQLDPDETKPPWWPSGVSHREPDHLPKAERIRLLIHLLCEIRTSYGVTARKLKEADQPIRRQISPVERLLILDEMYEVREKEERFLEGATDGKPLVSISRANLPDEVEASLGLGDHRQSTSPVEEEPAPKRDPETSHVVRRPAPVVNTSQAVLAPGGDLSVNTSPGTHSAAHSSAQYMKTDLPIHTVFNPASGPMPQPEMKRKRQCVDTGMPPTTATTPLGYYSPMFVGSQPFVTGSWGGMQGFPPQGVLPPGQPGTEQFDEPVFPYFFDF